MFEDNIVQFLHFMDGETNAGKIMSCHLAISVRVGNKIQYCVPVSCIFTCLSYELVYWQITEAPSEKGRKSHPVQVKGTQLDMRSVCAIFSLACFHLYFHRLPPPF